MFSVIRFFSSRDVLFSYANAHVRSYLVKVTKKIPKGEIFYYVFGSWEVREFREIKEVREFREIKEVRERDGGFEGRVVLMWR